MFKHKRILMLLVLALLIAVPLASCSPAAQPAPSGQTPQAGTPGATKFRVAFVYVAPIGDLGWSWAHDQGRLQLERETGVETAFIENVPEGPEAERVIRDFAQKGYNLVITTSFGFMDPTVAVAKDFPNTWFVHVSGYQTAANLSTIFGKMEQPRYLAGMVAGRMTKSNKLGFVAAFPIPEVIRGINAFTLGARSVNPNATVSVVWTQTWFDPVKEKEAAVALLDAGCDIIAQHQDTTEPQKAAQERNALSIGYDSDMAKFVGDTVLTSPIWNWGPKYIEIVRSIQAGTYKTESYYGGMKDGIIDLAPFSARVPDDVRALVQQKKQDMIAGKTDALCGPINAQNGQLAIPAGVCMTDEQALSMDWFVQGVQGEAPGKAPVASAAPAATTVATKPSAAATPTVAAATATTVATKPAVQATTAAKPRVAFIYVGPTGDMGWTYAHDQGRLALEKDLGIQTAYSELVAEGPDSTRIIRDYAQKGYDIIFATSFGYMDSVIEVAKEFPNVVFEHCTGYQTAPNAGVYDGRGYQGWYLAGVTAGKMTKKNVLGYIAPYPIPEVVRNMNAFALGARSVNPQAEVRPVWIFAWVDPVKERQAAQALLDQGVDVIARESDSTEPDKLAQENKIYCVGYNAYQPNVAPDALLTAPIWRWGIYYKQAVQDVMNKTWKNTPVWWGLKEGLLEMAPFGKMVPEDVKALVEREKQRIISGQFDVFVGPIKDNTGKERVPAGQTMADEQKLAFDWLVEGVVGSIPQ